MDTHPVQSRHTPKILRTEVTLAAYEVYCEVYGAQKEMVTGGCRGGFSGGELIAFLYARAFPKHEWRERVEQAFFGMVE